MIVTISPKEDSNSNKDLHVVNSWSFQNMSKNKRKSLPKRVFSHALYNTVCYTQDKHRSVHYTTHYSTVGRMQLTKNFNFTGR